MNYASAAEWLSSVGPLVVPLVMSWFELRGMRRELREMRQEVREIKRTDTDHEVRIKRLESIVTEAIAV
jgi:protein involved in ribonucleotide reduction